MRLKDKVAIITGGSRGIGFATADKFLKEGATVILAASTQASANKAVAQLQENEIISDGIQILFDENISVMLNDRIRCFLIFELAWEHQNAKLIGNAESIPRSEAS